MGLLVHGDTVYTEHLVENADSGADSNLNMSQKDTSTMTNHSVYF